MQVVNVSPLGNRKSSVLSVGCWFKILPETDFWQILEIIKRDIARRAIHLVLRAQGRFGYRLQTIQRDSDLWFQV